MLIRLELAGVVQLPHDYAGGNPNVRRKPKNLTSSRALNTTVAEGLYAHGNEGCSCPIVGLIFNGRFPNAVRIERVERVEKIVLPAVEEKVPDLMEKREPEVILREVSPGQRDRSPAVLESQRGTTQPVPRRRLDEHEGHPRLGEQTLGAREEHFRVPNPTEPTEFGGCSTELGRGPGLGVDAPR